MNTKAFRHQKLVKFYQLKENQVVDKFAVCVKKENEIVGHLSLGKDGKFAKAVFCFLRTDEYGSWNVFIKEKPVNLGDGDGMQVSCTLTQRNKILNDWPSFFHRSSHPE